LSPPWRMLEESSSFTLPVDPHSLLVLVCFWLLTKWDSGVPRRLVKHAAECVCEGVSREDHWGQDVSRMRVAPSHR
jgi:hypothetical protein